MSIETGSKPSKPKAPERKGKKIGGDDSPTCAWSADYIGGKLDSITRAQTRYGDRTRLIILTDRDTACVKGAGEGDGELVTVAKGEPVGVWLPSRWATSLDPFKGKPIAIYRDVKGTQVRYDVREG